MKRRFDLKLVPIAAACTLMFAFQNCGEVQFTPSDNSLGSLGVCDGVSCQLTPLTHKPAVVTVLIALGDEANSQLVVNGASAQLIAESAVRYSTPVNDPKILVVMDRGRGAEDPEDSVYVTDVLLKRYRVTMIEEPMDGLSANDLAGYNLVWFNNPGTAMTDVRSRDALIGFAGGVILQGDDLSRGTTFSNESLTGLQYLDNGAEVLCDGVTYPHDNNTDYKFHVTVDPSKIPGANSQTIEFEYGNDIDNTIVVRPGTEVVAYARGGPATCTEQRPAIVRYLKN